MAINATRAILKQSKSALLICDVQEKCANFMYEFNKVTQNSIKLINSLKLLEIPMIVCEQNPESLGKTIPEFDISSAKGPFAKTEFSMWMPEIDKELSTICSGNKPEAIILIGLETHVCIENTAIDLKQSGYEVHIVADCCTSRRQEDRLLALERMKAMGCHVATVENVVYKLVRSSKHKEFKNILNLTKPLTLDTGLAVRV
ncbi:isochorismatase domain-containing protein 2 [Ptiloglossa arizonensis]|uniref:isochorismatase domain-containing protein 2 n=1 Tax=Ptiloglossa arizonensis TaxID=3350558 RepID=UPI003FA12B33